MAKRYSLSFRLAVTAVFTALVCAATIVFSIYVPSTQGFFNIGESMVFLSALLFGPFVGAFAGGVGAMIADIFLGYPHYAPATLLIKACEGYVVGTLKSRNPRFSNTKWKSLTLTLGAVAGILLAVIGSFYYSGAIEVTLGFTSFYLFVPTVFWLILGIIVALFLTVIGFTVEPEYGWTIFSVIAGGFTMVLGYFIYQMFFIGWLFNIQVVAIAEIPINIGQMTIGSSITLPVTRIVRRYYQNANTRKL